MATLYNADLKPLTPGTYTHPYQHATKLFLADNFRLTPKQSFLYYVVININNNLGNDLIKFRLPVAQIQQQAGVRFPMPANAKELNPGQEWPVDFGALTNQKRKICGANASAD